MQINHLQQLYAKHPHTEQFAQLIAQHSGKALFLSHLGGSAAPVFLANHLTGSRYVTLVVLNDLESAGYFYHDLVQLLGDEQVLFFPSSYRRSIKYAQRDPAAEILRTEVLSRLQQSAHPFCIVSYPEAIAEKVVSVNRLNHSTLQLQVGERIAMRSVEQQLTAYGFQRVDYVYEPGQFALRGSLVDLFSYASEYPYRIDFFGDEVDSIRTFEIESQLSKERKERVAIVPSLSQAMGDEVSFFTFLPPTAVLGFADIHWVSNAIDTLHHEALSPAAVAALAAEQQTTPTLQSTIDGESFMKSVAKFTRFEFGNKPTATPTATLHFDISEQPIFHKNFELFYSTITPLLANGYRLYILADSPKQTDRLQAIFADSGKNITFTPINKTLHSGFTDHTLRQCFFTDHQIFDRFHKYNLRSEKARSGKVALTLKELSLFEVGDYVVHMDHGVGRFAGLVRIPNGNSTQEVIKLIYQHNDVVFVSIHSLHKIAKYKGKEGEPPRINRLGTGAWEKLKEKTKSRIKDIARDLIKLYAQRREKRGFAFSPDSFMHHELEASFIYEDTPDQLKATVDVKHDMERDQPMDRLVCGDVGFGKTEIAIRAAFKAVADNKQVAVLVPTTILAYQHFKTFSERLANFPCKVDYLSRARKAADVKRIIGELKAGEIQIVVGTHRLIGKEVQFKDLGLLIVDEEQKFGVAVKEKLKQLKVNVDTLTMTATPIPRTLQFSLMGARDLSVIQTPPPNRYPIQTELHTFNKELIAEAINFEMSRNGQVFFVNNRVQNLGELQDMIETLVPGVRVGIGHGQMEPEALEKVIYDFVNYDYDVLLATTIVENGIDIPNANTIIINHAQNFGLSDLHQMRGRVGRSNKKSFCYLLAPPLALLTTDARRRLQAIENFSDLGSGIHIAMQDLDIRGAGNLLGAEQSGFIADLGYETYQKILAEAVKELKDNEFAQLYMDAAAEKATQQRASYVEECAIESDMELLFAESYIPSSSERMLLYRELDNIEDEAAWYAYKNRLKDRFGTIPYEGEELLRIAPLRMVGKQLGIEKIVLKQQRMSLFFVSNPDSPYYQSDTFGKVIDYLTTHPRQCNLRELGGKRNLLVRNVSTVADALGILQAIQRGVALKA